MGTGAALYKQHQDQKVINRVLNSVGDMQDKVMDNIPSGSSWGDDPFSGKQNWPF